MSSKLESTIAWLDFAEDDRRKMMEVVTLFKLRETRDELGLGSIRNLFAEMLFPGTGTMQTRARYFLIVPWIYQQLENKRIPSSKISERLKREEARVISILVQGDTDGVIGRLSGASLTRFPSNIYWYGLQRWNIFQHHMNQGQYHRSLDHQYLHWSSTRTNDDGEPLDRGSEQNWDPNLPKPPENFPEELTLQLRPEEASYLREKLILHCRDSMLPQMVETGVPLDQVQFAWLHPSIASFPRELRATLQHARNISELMYGAALLYNFMLAELDGAEDLIANYQEALDGWRGMINDRLDSFRAWDRKAFWRMVNDNGSVPVLTRQFLQSWFRHVLTDDNGLFVEERNVTRTLVRSREEYLKRGRSRFHSKRHRELWGGSSGSFQLDFRWWVARRICNDIIVGLGGE